MYLSRKVVGASLSKDVEMNLNDAWHSDALHGCQLLLVLVLVKDLRNTAAAYELTGERKRALLN